MSRPSEGDSVKTCTRSRWRAGSCTTSSIFRAMPAASWGHLPGQGMTVVVACLRLWKGVSRKQKHLAQRPSRHMCIQSCCLIVGFTARCDAQLTRNVLKSSSLPRRQQLLDNIQPFGGTWEGLWRNVILSHSRLLRIDSGPVLRARHCASDWERGSGNCPLQCLGLACCFNCPSMKVVKCLKVSLIHDSIVQAVVFHLPLQPTARAAPARAGKQHPTQHGFASFPSDFASWK